MLALQDPMNRCCASLPRFEEVLGSIAAVQKRSDDEKFEDAGEKTAKPEGIDGRTAGCGGVTAGCKVKCDFGGKVAARYCGPGGGQLVSALYGGHGGGQLVTVPYDIIYSEADHAMVGWDPGEGPEVNFVMTNEDARYGGVYINFDKNGQGGELDEPGEVLLPTLYQHTPLLGALLCAAPQVLLRQAEMGWCAGPGVAARAASCCPTSASRPPATSAAS